MKVWIKVAVVFFGVVTQNLYAVEVDDLYEIEVITKSELAHDKDAAIKQAMRGVLSRILAGDNIFQDALVNSVLNNATDYVKEYQLSLAETQGIDARLMRVLFHEKWLVNTLRPGKNWLWNEIRPRTLLWLVVEEGGAQRFFSPDEMPEVDWALKKSSRYKKIPILFPIQDLKEQRIVSVGDVLSAYSEYLLEVSVRYEVVSTLAGKLVKGDGCWKAEWTLYFDGKIEQWRSPCSSIEKVTLGGFQGVYGHLSDFYAAKQEVKKVDGFMMKVSGIKLMADVKGINEYLEGLPMVNTATWLKAEGGHNLYRIFHQGLRSELNNRLNLDHVLVSESPLNLTDTEVNYRFINK